MDYAICVGVSRYRFPNALRGPVDDAKDVSAALVSRCAFDLREIRLLCDERATAAAIRSSLREVVALLGPGDRFLFWFSGHGARLVDGDVGVDVLCPIDFDFTLQRSVTAYELHDLLARIPPGVDAAWGSDACHDGDLDRDARRPGVPKLFRRDLAFEPSPSKVHGMRDAAAGTGVALVTASRGDETAADAFVDGRYKGAFTHSFLAELRGPGGEDVAFEDLVARTRRALASSGFVQAPQVAGAADALARPFLRPPR